MKISTMCCLNCSTQRFSLHFALFFHFSLSLICCRTYRVQWTQLSMGLCPRTLEGVYKLPVRSVVIMNAVQRGQDILKWTWKLKVCHIMELMRLNFLTLHQQELEALHQWLMCSAGLHICIWISIVFVHNLVLDLFARDRDLCTLAWRN